MRLVLICALLIGLVMVPFAVMAEEPAAMENETAVVNVSEENSDAGATTAELAPLFGKVHTTLLMATEEAFGYLLSNDTAEKEQFFIDIAASEDAMAAFEVAAGEAGENEKALVTGFEEVSVAYANMTTAADAMFASFEAEGKPVLEDVTAFEESVDAVFNASDDAWTAYNPDNDNVPQNAGSSVRALYGRLLAATQESYAYPILGDEIEKEDALADFAEFDTIVAKAEETYPDESYDDLKALRAELQAATEAVFASYEKDGVANADDIAALEALVEQMDEEAMKLFDSAAAEKPVVEESAVSEDAAANATA